MELNKEYDNVNNPQHYAGSCSLECIEVMEITFGRNYVLHFCLCNAFKYMWRYKNKNGQEDLEKSKWYLNYIMHYIERDGSYNLPEDVVTMYDRLNDMYIDITDRIANNGGDVNA